MKWREPFAVLTLSTSLACASAARDAGSISVGGRTASSDSSGSGTSSRESSVEEASEAPRPASPSADRLERKTYSSDTTKKSGLDDDSFEGEASIVPPPPPPKPTDPGKLAETDAPARPRDLEPRPAERPPASAGVKAGASDDNLQFNAFLKFIGENDGIARSQDISHRVVLSVVDRNGLPIANARVEAQLGGQVLAQRTTYADGRTLLFPSTDPRMKRQDAELRIESQGVSVLQPLVGPRVRTVKLDVDRQVPGRVPLDIVFILDTTGSMGDEIEQLRSTIQVIHWQISNMTPTPDVRFGMVLFKDQEDEYVTQVVPFTSELPKFQETLRTISAGGGGDTPEDVEAALEAAVKMPWRADGARLAFLIGDAAPHLDYGRSYDYLSSTRTAAARGIKITSIGASGLDRQAEFVWRQIAQYTMAPFVFLTYGETSDAEGSPSSVSHHVGSNWVADSLDAIVIKMVKVELSHFMTKGAPERPDYFTAAASPNAQSDLILDDLFRQAQKQLIDYAVEPILDRTPTAVLPVSAKKPELEKRAEQLGTRLEVSLGRNRSFQLVETKATPKLMNLVAIQMGPTFDAGGMIEVGKLVPAKLAVLSQLDENDRGELELVVKLVKLETGEVLSLSLLKIEGKLLAS